MSPILNEETAVSTIDYLTQPYTRKINSINNSITRLLEGLTPEQAALIQIPRDQRTPAQIASAGLTDGFLDALRKYNRFQDQLAEQQNAMNMIEDVRPLMERYYGQAATDINMAADVAQRGNTLAGQNNAAAAAGEIASYGAGVGQNEAVAARHANQAAITNAQIQAQRMQNLAQNAQSAAQNIPAAEANKLQAEEAARLNIANAKLAKVQTAQTLENNDLQRDLMQAQIDSYNRQGTGG